MGSAGLLGKPLNFSKRSSMLQARSPLAGVFIRSFAHRGNHSSRSLLVLSIAALLPVLLVPTALGNQGFLPLGFASWFQNFTWLPAILVTGSTAFRQIRKTHGFPLGAMCCPVRGIPRPPGRAEPGSPARTGSGEAVGPKTWPRWSSSLRPAWRRRTGGARLGWVPRCSLDSGHAVVAKSQLDHLTTTVLLRNENQGNLHGWIS